MCASLKSGGFSGYPEMSKKSKTQEPSLAFPCAMYAPGRELTQLVIKAKNIPGVLAEIASEIAKHNINILSGLILAEPYEKVGEICMFLDLTESRLTFEQLVEKLKNLSSVLDVREAVRRFGDLVVNSYIRQITVLDRQAILLTTPHYVELTLEWLDEVFGTGGHAILFEIGVQTAKRAIKSMRERFNLRGRELIEAFLALHAAGGWFRYEIVKYDEEGRSFVIRLYDNIECKVFIGKKDKPVNHLIRGELEGAFDEAYGGKFKAIEVKCIARGDDYCEFVITG